jgi:hypothetical protein
MPQRALNQDDPLDDFERRAGQPTLAARDEILSFFARRLAPSR